MTSYRDRHLAGHYTTPATQDAATVPDLKEQAKALNVSVSGSKDELQKRVEKARTDAAPREPEPS